MSIVTVTDVYCNGCRLLYPTGKFQILRRHGGTPGQLASQTVLNWQEILLALPESPRIHRPGESPAKDSRIKVVVVGPRLQDLLPAKIGLPGVGDSPQQPQNLPDPSADRQSTAGTPIGSAIDLPNDVEVLKLGCPHACARILNILPLISGGIQYESSAVRQGETASEGVLEQLIP
jgi:hypothetical protein